MSAPEEIGDGGPADLPGETGATAPRRAGGRRSHALELLRTLATDAATPHPTHLADRGDLARAGRAEDAEAITAARRVASLLDGYRQRASQAAPLLKTARELLVCADTDAVLRVAARRARRALAFDVAFVAWPQATGNGVRFPATDGACRLRDHVLTHLDGTGLGALALAGRSVVWTPDYLADASIPRSPGADAIARDEGLRCVAAVPLDQSGRRSGLLFLAQRRMHHLSAEELGFLAEFSEIVSAALDALTGGGRDGTLGASGVAEFCAGLGWAALGPEGAQGVLTRAASVLGGPALLRSPSGRTLARTGEMPPSLLEAVPRALPDAVQGREPVRLSGCGRLTAVGPPEEVLGYLVTAFSGADAPARLLPVVAQALAAAIVHARSVATADTPEAGDGLLDALCAARTHALAHLVEAAGERGVPVEGSHVLVVRPAEGSAQWVTSWLRAHPSGPGQLLAVRGGDAVVLTPAADGGTAARRLGERLRDGTGREVTVGAAGPVPAADRLDETRRAATRCADALIAVHGPGAAGSLDELGVLGVALTGAGDLRGFADRQLRAVVEHDERASGALVDTLDAYFAAGRGLNRAASALYVHPNTVARRLEKLGELLGDDWQSPRRALDLQIALMVRRMRDVVAPLRTADIDHI